jgi:hypothetical protein
LGVRDPCASAASKCINGRCRGLNANDYVCTCQLGYVGRTCEKKHESLNASLEYKGDSFVWWHVNNTSNRTDRWDFLSLAIYPHSTLSIYQVLYSEDQLSGHYITVSFRQGFVYMRYNLGSGTFSAKLRQILSSVQWIRIILYHDIDGNWILQANNQVKQLINSKTVAFNFPYISLGSIPDDSILPSYYHEYRGFQGCMDDLVIAKGKEILDLKLVRSESADVCSESYDPCLNNKCQNEGTCIATVCGQTGQCVQGEELYRCLCAKGYTGHECELSIVCMSNPCINGGSCIGAGEKFTCVCSPAFSGVQCNRTLFTFDEKSPLSSLIIVSWDPSFITEMQTNWTANTFTLEYYITGIDGRPPITALIPTGQQSVEVSNLKYGFNYNFTLIVADNSTALSFSVVYQKQSLCSIGKYGPNCDKNCDCLPDVSLGTCAPGSGDCYCSSQLDAGNADGLSVIPVSVLWVVNVDTNSVDFSVFDSQTRLSVPFIEQLLLYQKLTESTIVRGIDDFVFASNCTLGTCSSPYLKANTTYAFVIQAIYNSSDGTENGISQCFSGVKYVTTKPHACPLSCSCFEDENDRSSFLYTQCSRMGLTEVPANISEKTTHLYLDNNHIFKISENAFRHIKQNIVIDLSNNNISSIQGAPFPTTAVLMLSHNHIKGADTICHAFSNATSLSYLDLGHNSFVQILCSFSNFGSPPTALKTLLLNDNKLTKVELLGVTYIMEVSNL